MSRTKNPVPKIYKVLSDTFKGTVDDGTDHDTSLTELFNVDAGDVEQALHTLIAELDLGNDDENNVLEEADPKSCSIQDLIDLIQS